MSSTFGFDGRTPVLAFSEAAILRVLRVAATGRILHDA
jgi:hypothetical protein